MVLNTGSEFMPPLDEGSILYMPVTLPGASITEVNRILQEQDKIIKTVPEVHHVLGKTGRAETATDNAPLSMIETIIVLKPKDEWRPGITKQDIVAELDHKLQIPSCTAERIHLGLHFFQKDDGLENICRSLKCTLHHGQMLLSQV